MSGYTSRRCFLKNSTLAGAGLVVAGSGRVSAGEDVDGVVRVALVGAGAQGEALIGACLDSWEAVRVRFSAVCDVWAELNLSRAIELLGKYDQPVRGYTDIGEMLNRERDLDAVIVATPDHLHAEQVVGCLEAGLAVYCEAPLANTLEGARAMVRAARVSGRPLQIGYQRRSNPKYVHCRDRLLGEIKLLGRVTSVQGQSNHAVQADLGWSRRRALDEETLTTLGYPSMHAFKNWRWYRGLGGGPLLAYGAHQIDVMNWFMGGPPRTISARGGIRYYDPKTHQWPDTVMAVLEYAVGEEMVTASYQMLTASGYGGRYEAFLGDQGAIELSESGARAGVYRDPAAPDWDRWVQLGLLETRGEPVAKPAEPGVIQARPTQPPARYEVPIRISEPQATAHLTNFFDAVRGKGVLACPPEAAYASLVTVLKIMEAIEAGRTVELTPDQWMI